MSPSPAIDPAPAHRQAGIAAIAELPCDGWADRWNRIFCDPETKKRLLNAALFALGRRVSTSRVGLPAHRLLLLSGPPGTGKTTLAHGLADRLARELRARGLAPGVRFALIDPHALPSELLGESQRSAARLFDRIIPDLAADGHPLVVLLDEVEALAVDRRRVAPEVNPVDVQRATDAVITGVDLVAAKHPNVLFIATTNLADMVDEALLSRADLMETFGLPPADAVEAILRDTLAELDVTDAGLPGQLRSIAARCAEQGTDARQVRKLVLQAMFSGDAELALGLRPLTGQDLLDVFALAARPARDGTGTRHDNAAPHV